MPDEKNTAVFSSLATNASPESSVEPAATTATQPAEVSPATTEAAPETVPPSETTHPAASEPENYEVRFKDTQRALSTRERELEITKAKLEALQGVLPQNTQPDPKGAMQEIERLKEEMRNDPGNTVDYVNKILNLRDQHYNDQLAGLYATMENRLVEVDPEFQKAQDKLKLIDDIPGAQYLSSKAKLEIVRRLQGAGPAAARQPPASIAAGQRAAPQAPKAISAEEKFAAHLRASGAIQDGNGKGKLAFHFER